MSETESFLRAFHAACPGVTTHAFARGGTYERFAARARALAGEGRVLDLACGDGPLLARLGPRALGLDLAHGDLARCADTGRITQARAEALPFCDRAFAVVACHLAFMLFDRVDEVVGELARVLEPGGTFIALLGGGPTADGADAFHAFARLLPAGRALGDSRAKSEAGWRELFVARGWQDLAFERWPVDLSGTFDEVWAFLGSSYQLAPGDAERVRAALRAQFPGERVPCEVACYCASVRR